MDVERLKQLAALGDNDAIDALIREAARRNDGSLVNPTWALDSARGLGRGMGFPLNAYPEHLQDIHPALACTLYRLEHWSGVTHYRNRAEGWTDGTKAIVSVHLTQTAKGGRLAGGFSLTLRTGTTVDRNTGATLANLLSGSLIVYDKSCRVHRIRLADKAFSWIPGDAEGRGRALRAVADAVCGFYRPMASARLVRDGMQKMLAREMAESIDKDIIDGLMRGYGNCYEAPAVGTALDINQPHDG